MSSSSAPRPKTGYFEERHAKAARIGEDGWFHGARLLGPGSR